MKIIAEETIAEETVVRYRVETLILKRIGFLPPYAELRARLWSTQAETNAIIAKESRS